MSAKPPRLAPALPRAGGVASTRLLGSLLYGVSATDPATSLGMALILLLVAAIAGGLPAARAARTRGVRVLRAE